MGLAAFFGMIWGFGRCSRDDEDEVIVMEYKRVCIVLVVFEGFLFLWRPSC